MGARLLLVVSGAGGDWHQGFPHDGARDARTHSDDDDGGDDDDDDGGGDGALPQQPFLITSAPSASKLPISIHPVMATMILMIFQLVNSLLMTNITLHRFVTLNGSLLG